MGKPVYLLKALLYAFCKTCKDLYIICKRVIMSMNNTLTWTQFTQFDQESLQVDFEKQHIAAKVNAVGFIDKDTKMSVIYIPALEISGYGESLEQAKEMLHFNVSELFAGLVQLSSEELEAELGSMGWRKDLLDKVYSKAFVDMRGVLQNLNAENDTVETMALTAA